MKYYPSGSNYVLVLEKSEELFESLGRFVKEAKISSGWVSGLGAALEVELGYYDLANKKYHWKTFSGPLEITGLQGNIVQKNGQPVFHAHGSFSDENYRVVGGHIKSMIVAGTCELLVTKLGSELTRRHDENVGLDLLSEL